MADAPPTEGLVSAVSEDVKLAEAQASVKEVQAVKADLDKKLVQPAIQMSSIDTAKAGEIQPKPPTPRAGGAVAEVESEGFLGIHSDDWFKIFACFFVLYSCLVAFYASLLTIAIHIRGGGEYKSMPTTYYGPFDRDYYYSEMGSRRADREVLYPWIKDFMCNVNPTQYVCTPDCDILTTPFEGLNCQYKECGLKCINP